MKKVIFLILLSLCLLSGCLKVTDVIQPYCVDSYAEFTVIMKTENSVDDTARPGFAVLLPDDWQVLECTYSGAHSGNCTVSSGFKGFMDLVDPPGAGEKWAAYEGDITSMITGDQMTVTWRIRSGETFPLQLTYAAAVGSNNIWFMDLPNLVSRPMGHCIPTLGDYGLYVLFLGLAFGALYLLRKKKLKNRVFIQFLFVGCCLGLLGAYFMGSPIAADDSANKVALTIENAKTICEQMKEDRSYRTAFSSDPKGFVTDHFDLDASQKQRLSEIQDGNLTSAWEKAYRSDENCLEVFVRNLVYRELNP